MAYASNSSSSGSNGAQLISNLGVNPAIDSRAIVEFLEGITDERLEFNASEYDAVIGFFTGKGYTDQAAQSLSYILLRQSKIDNVPIFQVLDSLRPSTPIVLSQLVAEILNAKRYKTSVLGYKSARSTVDHISRNIKA